MQFNNDNFRALSHNLETEEARYARFQANTIEVCDTYGATQYDYDKLVEEMVRICTPIATSLSSAKRCCESVAILRERTLAAIKHSDQAHQRHSAESMAKAAKVSVGAVVLLLKQGKIKLSTQQERYQADRAAESSERQLADAVSTARTAIARLSADITDGQRLVTNIKLHYERPIEVTVPMKLVKLPTDKRPFNKLERMEKMNRNATIAERVPEWVLQDERDAAEAKQAHYEYLERQRIERNKAKMERNLQRLAEESSKVLEVFGS